MRNNKHFAKSLVATSLLLALVGCGDDDTPNVAPTADAGADFTVDELTTAMLSGSGEDTDGSIASYSWTQTAGTSVTIENATSAQAQFVAPDVRPSETLTFELTVTDDDGETSTDSVNVEVTHINATPVLDTPDQSVAEKSNVVLNAVAEDDSEIVAYAWAQVSGETVELTGADTDTLSFTAPSVTEDTTLSFSLTVEDDEGATATQTVDVVITQELVSFTLKGLVTDSPIANANVVLHVGSETVETTADASGEYSVEVSTDDDDTDKMVSIVATGVDEQALAKLTSILGSISALENVVNDEGIIDSEALFSVNVTNVTTAFVALMQRENLGEEIDSDEELEALSLRVSPEEKFALATAIKVAIDVAQGDPNLSLPDSVTDTLALAQNTEIAQAYIQSISETSEFETAYQEIINDPEIIDQDTSSLTQSFFITDFNNPLLSYPGKFVEIGSGGTVSYLDYSGEYEGEWELSNGALVLSFADSAFTNLTSESVEIDGNTQTVDVEISVVELSFVQLENVSGVLTLEETKSYIKRYPNGELPDTEIISDPVTQRTALTTENIAAVTVPSGTDKGIALPMPSPLFSTDNADITRYALSADTFIMNEGGTGTTEQSELTFQWEFIPWEHSSDVDVLSITFDMGVTLQYLQLTQQPDVNLYALWGVPADGEDVSFKIDAGDIISQDEGFDEASVPGIYTYSFDGETINEFWWELWENGRAYSISTNDANGDGELTSDEVSVMYGNWAVDEQGALTINRFLSVDYTWPGCFELSASCYHYNKRSWKLFAQSGNTYHITNRHEFDFLNAEGNGGFDGVFDYDFTDNRRVSKSDHRPVSVALPYNAYLPKLPPLTFNSLVSPSAYFDQALYGVEQNILFELDSAQLEMQLNSDDTFTYSSEETGELSGDFEVFSDNSLELTVAQGSAVQAFLMASDDVIIAANDGYPVPFFTSEAQAEAYEELLRNSTSAAPVSDLEDTQLVMVELSDEDIWVALYVMFDGSEATLYTDETFSEVRSVVSYVTNDDGSVTFTDRMYVAMTTTDFSVFASEQEGFIDFNYMFADVEKAKAFVRNANALLSKAYMDQ